MNLRASPVLMCGLALWFAARALADDTTPGMRPVEWVWADVSDVGADAPIELRATFHVDRPPSQARLRLAAEFCRATVTLGDRQRFVVEAYGPWIDLDVLPWLVRGANELHIEAVACEPLAAIAAELTLAMTDGETARVATSGRWQARASGVGDVWSAARSLGPVSAALWGHGTRAIATTAFDDYEQWRKAVAGASATSAASIVAPDGFRVELLRSAAADEGSWVAVACDERGRVVVAREERGLLRFTLADNGQSISRVELIDDTLEECRGLLFAHGGLYVNANKSRSTYFLRDADGDGHYEQRTLLRQPERAGGHGMNQLALGPDDHVYSIQGDAVTLPAAADLTLDRTSPLRELMPAKSPKEGYLLRATRDGRAWMTHPPREEQATESDGWEMVAAGLRNPFGLAFHPRDGEAFTYDADAEFDMGSAWYRPTRLVHLVSGADFGWRGVTGDWPPYYTDHADNALPVCDIGHGSPTSIRFGDGSHFPPAYRDALFMLDWAYGRVLAMHLSPRGGSYIAHGETFLQGRPLNVTGLDFGLDGAMYLVTGGRKTQSALYRVSYVGEAAPDVPPSAYELARLAHGIERRAARRRLEAWHGRQDAAALDVAWPWLGAIDPSLRYAARTAVEWQPVETWADRALEETEPQRAASALLALARARRPADAGPLVDRLNAIAFDEGREGLKLEVLQAYRLTLADRAALSADTLDAARRGLSRLLPPIDRPRAYTPTGMGLPVEAQVCELLIELDAPRAVPLALARLDRASAQEERLHYLRVLSRASVGWTEATRSRYFANLSATDTALGGQGMQGFLASIRADALAKVPENDRATFAALFETRSPQADETLPARPLVRRWRLDEIIAELDKQSDTGQAEMAGQRGRELYHAALCSRCHRLGSDGSSFGPDLTSVAARFTRRNILESIMAPSNVVADGFRAMQVETTDGRVLTGRVVETGDYRSQVLRVATDPLRPWHTVEVHKDDVAGYHESLVSPMPEGLLDTLTLDEIRALLVYIESSGAGE